MVEFQSEQGGKGVFKARLAIGLIQGFVLFLLFRAEDTKLWTDAYTFLPTAFMSLFLPLVAIVGLGNVHLRALLAWIGFLAAFIVIVTLSVAYKFAPFRFFDHEAFGQMLLLFIVSIFVMHTLFVAAQKNGMVIAPYSAYFELAWKHAVQIAAAVGFSLAFWALYFLGDALFKILKIDLLDRLIRDGRVIPVTAVLVAVALHVTDVRPNIIAGIRALALTLLSWLLPLMTALVVLFLGTVPVAGFDLLWNTRMATALLLTAAAALVILINAVYQNGPDEQTPPKVLQVAASAAAIALVPLALVAAYGLSLRVTQYGWTGDRIIAAAAVVVALGYAGGYAFAAIRRGPWFVFLERTNIAMSGVVVLIAFLLHTPIGDPDRISVNSQVARLKDGRTPPEKFDLAYLRFQSGRYGTDALDVLKTDTALDAAMRERVEAAIKSTIPDDISSGPLTAEMLASSIQILSPGKTLPMGFLVQDGGKAQAVNLPDCLQSPERCQAMIVDLNRDGADEVVLFRVYESYVESGHVFQQVDGAWQHVAQLPAGKVCLQTLEAIRKGDTAAVAPAWDDLDVGGQRIDVNPDAGDCQSSEYARPVN